MNPALGEVVGLLIALPFVALADYFGWIKQQPLGQQELAKACHGLGMLALLGFWFSLTGGFVDSVAELALNPENPLNWIPAGMAAWGLGWLLLNARFAALSVGRPHRATMIVRALIKIALGWAAWAFAEYAGLATGSDGSALLALVLHVVAVWCLATGGTKLLLMIWGGRHGKARPMVEEDIADKEFDWDD